MIMRKRRFAPVDIALIFNFTPTPASHLPTSSTSTKALESKSKACGFIDKCPRHLKANFGVIDRSFLCRYLEFY